jgi:hypothetical protein
LETLPSPPTIDDAQHLRECLAGLVEAGQLVMAARQLDRDSAEQLALARNELLAYASTAECPTCGAPLDPQRLLSRAAVGLGGHAHD